jgi:putative ABC transport system substrate-binding protein
MNAGALPTKRLELLHELVPTATTVGILVNASNANAAADVVAVESAAQRIGLQVVIASIAEAETDFNGVFEALTRANASALLVNTDAFFSSRRDQLVALAFSYGIPTVYSIREFVEVGGLASYGNDLADAYRHAGVYVGPILKGARPGDLPVLQPTKFDLVINLKAAKVFGIEISPTLLARADEVIE